MKKIILFAALAAFALTSCQQEITFEENKSDGLVFTATTEIPSTKTALDASLKVVWQVGDEITIMGGSNIGTYTTATGGDTKATFTRHSGSEATTSPRNHLARAALDRSNVRLTQNDALSAHIGEHIARSEVQPDIR